MASEEPAAIPETIAQLPFFTSGRHPKDDLLGRSEASGIVPVSSRQFMDRVREFGLGLQSLGLKPGDRVALLAESRPEWLIADLGTQASGAVTVPIYPTLGAEQVAYILNDSGASMVVASTPEQLQKVIEIAPTLPALEVAILMIGDPGQLRGAATTPSVHTMAEVSGFGHKAIQGGWGIAKEFQDRAKAVRPEDLATIVYTSGTTGEPKGVMLTHLNLTSNIEGALKPFRVDETDRALSFLPLCHAFERMVAYIFLTRGVSMIFAENLETIARDIKVVQPTVVTGVPRVWEKMHARIMAKGREGSAIKRAIFAWASRVAERKGDAIVTRGSASGWLGFQARIADRLVFHKIREGVGGRIRFAVSGSAPLGDKLGRWFLGVGIPLIEGYGLTETSPVLSVMPVEAIRFGTVGPPIPNVEIRIAQDGEIVARGPSIMRGYWNKPEATAAVLKDGWFCTGDIGQFDERGYLKITDRKKELLVTSGGKKIAPAPIETAIRRHSLVAEAVLLGDKRHFPAALIVPDFACLATALGAPRPTSPEDAALLAKRPESARLIGEVIEDVNKHLAQYERIKKFHILPREFTQAAGELTPTLKVKRRVIDEHFKAEIESLYSTPDELK